MTRQPLEKSQPTRIQGSDRWVLRLDCLHQSEVSGVDVSNYSHIYFSDESSCPANLLVSSCLLQQGMAYIAGRLEVTPWQCYSLSGAKNAGWSIFDIRATWTSHGSCSCRMPQKQRAPPVPQVSTAWELVVPPLELDENMPWMTSMTCIAKTRKSRVQTGFLWLQLLHILLYRIFESCVLHQLQQD